MREIIEKRRTHSKTFHLGGRRRRLRTSVAPLHYRCDGKLVDIDATPARRGRHFEVSAAPYALKLDPDRPAYFYTSESGKWVEAELIEAGGVQIKASPAAQDGKLLKWDGIAPDTDLVMQPLRKGIEALVIVNTPNAARIWRWRVNGDKSLLQPPKGHDAKNQRLELVHRYDGDDLVIEWTGRATSQQRLRRTEGWTEDIAYPVAIDPTVNEAIVDGADDLQSYWRNSGADFSYTFAVGQFLRAGRLAGGARTYVGLRFQTIGVPRGATIVSATLTMDVMVVNNSPDINVYGDDVDDAPPWSSPGSRVKDGLSKTTAVTNITPASYGPYPISVASIVQEIVNRPGWVSGNNMRFGLFNNATSGIHQVTFAAFEHTTATEAQLDIEYEEPGVFSGVYLGEIQINAIKLGSDDVVAAYYGTNQIFEVPD